MASGWNLWVWLQCIGVASGCCCKEVHVYRYPHNNYNFPYLSCITSFSGSSILTSLFIFKMFFRSLYMYFTRMRLTRVSTLKTFSNYAFPVCVFAVFV